MSKSPSVELTMMPLDDIRPYWRNPRRISEESVQAVAESIKQFGYLQPIVVDSEMVIIIGHTRYAALRRLGVTSAPVRIDESLSQAKVKELRVVDNRTSEFTYWDYESLVQEISDLDHSALEMFFPELVLDELNLGPDVIQISPDSFSESEFICPSCFHEWKMKLTREQIMSGRIEVEK